MLESLIIPSPSRPYIFDCLGRNSEPLCYRPKYFISIITSWFEEENLDCLFICKDTAHVLLNGSLLRHVLAFREYTDSYEEEEAYVALSKSTENGKHSIQSKLLDLIW